MSFYKVDLFGKIILLQVDSHGKETGEKTEER